MERTNHLYFTGDKSEPSLKTKKVKIDQYVITVLLDSSDSFIDVLNIKIDKDFYHNRTKLGEHQVEQFYQE